MFALKIVGGSIVDGTGTSPFVGDIGVADGVIVAVTRGAGSLVGAAAETIDATGLVVTPGFVDVHAHYDGQVTWDDSLEPSASHGVTTVVSGNCGVGFAPVRPGDEDWLIGVMEGVEDIPGAALAEGLTWGWESFSDYLDTVDGRSLAMDVGVQVAHGPVRGYVMGERGSRAESAAPEDIARMATLVRESIEAGALGFSTSRTLTHRAIDGNPVPGTFAAEDELFAIGRAAASGARAFSATQGHAVFELAPTGASGEDIIAPHREMDWMVRLAAEIRLPVSFALVQVDPAPTLWRELMTASIEAIERGAPVYPQITGRPFGMLTGFQGRHAFSMRPTYRALAARLSGGELLAELRRPAVRDAVLADADVPRRRGNPDDGAAALVARTLDRQFPLDETPDYEPTAGSSVAGRAAELGVDPMRMLYDLMLDFDGERLIMWPMFGYSDGDHDALREMLTHPAGVIGLGDGGAHVAIICDASLPTYMLTHWVRDRTRGDRLPLEYVVRKQTMDTAALFGLGDRGVLAAGKKADINVIDLERLTLHRPRVTRDLPAGGSRILQGASGYVATIVSGVVTRRNSQDTGARPGRLVRGAR
jgi:N-acyl-D-aspartate/D-glutamate deacylase